MTETRNSFNPRARGGRDPENPFVFDWTFLVSIHAPAGGATAEEPEEVAPDGVSIHAPAGGATPVLDTIQGGERCFNPRARGGRDYDASHGIIVLYVSIHAPAGGATV